MPRPTRLIVPRLIVHDWVVKHRESALKVLGSNLRLAREEKEMTQERLAEKAGLDPSYISGIERGIRNPSILSLARIARALDTTVADLTRSIES